MSKPKPISPWLKQALELGPTLIFFVLYLRIKDNVYTLGGTEYSGFIVAALVLVPILLIAMAALWALTGALSRIQIFTAIMVIVFGGLTAYFNDERFFKMKTTIVYGLFAILLGIGLALGRSWLAYILNDLIPMRMEGWMILTRRLCLGFATLAIANEVVWRTMSTEAWVTIETFVFPIALAGFLVWQMMQLQDYLIEDEDEDAGSDEDLST